MSDFKENRKGFIDLYHGKAKANGSNTAPDLEGQIKIDGKPFRCKLWLEVKEGVTNNERFTGYVFELEKSTK